MRLFLAFDLDDGLIREAERLSRQLREERALSRARWVAPSAMHVTLRFIGEADEPIAAELGALVTKLGSGRGPIDVRSTSLVAFGNVHRARVLGLAISDDGTLPTIASETERAVREMGIPPDPHDAYRPHLTLARLREPADLRRVVSERTVSLTGRITSIVLYESKTLPTGPVYTALSRAVLDG
jgi:2'-5' RNA ligase